MAKDDDDDEDNFDDETDVSWIYEEPKQSSAATWLLRRLLWNLPSLLVVAILRMMWMVVRREGLYQKNLKI